MLRSLTLLTLFGGHAIPTHALATCYGMEGTQMNSNYVPCNASSTGSASDASTDGTHSACCNAANADICLSSGLCLSTVAVALGHVLWLNRCTDKTLHDPSCPQYCRNMKLPPGPSDTYFLRACDRNETGNSWCCGVDGQNISACCSRSFKLRSNIGHLVQQLSPGGDTDGGSGRGNNDNTNNDVPFVTPSSFNPPRSTTTASHATTSSTTTTGNHKGLIAGLSVVSAVAAAALLALAAAILHIHRLAGRNHTLSAAAHRNQDDSAASAAPQVVEQAASSAPPSSLPLVEHRDVDNTITTHELSPISARIEPCEIGEAGGSNALRSLAIEGPATRSGVMIAELPADTVLKQE